MRTLENQARSSARKTSHSVESNANEPMRCLFPLSDTRSSGSLKKDTVKSPRMFTENSVKVTQTLKSPLKSHKEDYYDPDKQVGLPSTINFDSNDRNNYEQFIHSKHGHKFMRRKLMEVVQSNWMDNSAEYMEFIQQQKTIVKKDTKTDDTHKRKMFKVCDVKPADCADSISLTIPEKWDDNSYDRDCRRRTEEQPTRRVRQTMRDERDKRTTSDNRGKSPRKGQKKSSHPAGGRCVGECTRQESQEAIETSRSEKPGDHSQVQRPLKCVFEKSIVLQTTKSAPIDSECDSTRRVVGSYGHSCSESKIKRTPQSHRKKSSRRTKLRTMDEPNTVREKSVVQSHVCQKHLRRNQLKSGNESNHYLRMNVEKPQFPLKPDNMKMNTPIIVNRLEGDTQNSPGTSYLGTLFDDKELDWKKSPNRSPRKHMQKASSPIQDTKINKKELQTKTRNCESNAEERKTNISPPKLKQRLSYYEEAVKSDEDSIFPNENPGSSEMPYLETIFSHHALTPTWSWMTLHDQSDNSDLLICPENVDSNQNHMEDLSIKKWTERNQSSKNHRSILERNYASKISLKRNPRLLQCEKPSSNSLNESEIEVLDIDYCLNETDNEVNRVRARLDDPSLVDTRTRSSALHNPLFAENLSSPRCGEQSSNAKWRGGGRNNTSQMQRQSSYNDEKKTSPRIHLRSENQANESDENTRPKTEKSAKVKTETSPIDESRHRVTNKNHNPSHYSLREDEGKTNISLNISESARRLVHEKQRKQTSPQSGVVECNDCFIHQQSAQTIDRRSRGDDLNANIGGRMVGCEWKNKILTKPKPRNTKIMDIITERDEKQPMSKSAINPLVTNLCNLTSFSNDPVEKWLDFQARKKVNSNLSCQTVYNFSVEGKPDRILKSYENKNKKCLNDIEAPSRFILHTMKTPEKQSKHFQDNTNESNILFTTSNRKNAQNYETDERTTSSFRKYSYRRIARTTTSPMNVLETIEGSVCSEKSKPEVPNIRPEPWFKNPTMTSYLPPAVNTDHTKPPTALPLSAHREVETDRIVATIPRTAIKNNVQGQRYVMFCAETGQRLDNIIVIPDEIGNLNIMKEHLSRETHIPPNNHGKSKHKSNGHSKNKKLPGPATLKQEVKSPTQGIFSNVMKLTSDAYKYRQSSPNSVGSYNGGGKYGSGNISSIGTDRDLHAEDARDEVRSIKTWSLIQESSTEALKGSTTSNRLSLNRISGNTRSTSPLRNALRNLFERLSKHSNVEPSVYKLGDNEVEAFPVRDDDRFPAIGDDIEIAKIEEDKKLPGGGLKETLWSVVQVSVFKDGSKTYEIMKPSKTKPDKIPTEVENVFVLVAHKKES